MSQEKNIFLDYLDTKGIKYKWFAEQIGMNRVQWEDVIHNKKKCPKKYWTTIVVVSKGEITIDDLLNYSKQFERKKNAIRQSLPKKNCNQSANGKKGSQVGSRDHGELPEEAPKGQKGGYLHMWDISRLPPTL